MFTPHRLDTSVAEGRPLDHLLAVTVDPQSAPLQTPSPLVNDVSRVMEQAGSLIQLQSDQPLVREVEDGEPVGGRA